MAWLPIPDEDEVGAAFLTEIVNRDRDGLMVIVAVDGDAFALDLAQLARVPIVQMLQQIRERGARVTLARIPQRPPGPLH